MQHGVPPKNIENFTNQNNLTPELRTVLFMSLRKFIPKFCLKIAVRDITEMTWIGPWLSPSSSRMGQKAYITQQNTSNGVFPKINARMSVHSFNFFNLKEESCQSLAKGRGFSPSHWRFSCPSAPTPQSLLLGKHYNFLLFRNHAVGVPTQSTHVLWVNGFQRKCWRNSVERDTFFKDVLPVRVQTIKSEYKNRKMSTPKWTEEAQRNMKCLSMIIQLYANFLNRQYISIWPTFFHNVLNIFGSYVSRSGVSELSCS